jgi:hypothetical protein
MNILSFTKLAYLFQICIITLKLNIMIQTLKINIYISTFSKIKNLMDSFLIN